MTVWQRRARLVIGVFAVGFAIVVAYAFRHRAAPPAQEPINRLDPKAMVESVGGHLSRVRFSREDLSIDFEKQLTYADGTTKLIGVKVVTTNRGDGRTFTVTANEGEVKDNPPGYKVDGDVRMLASDGLNLRTEHATYEESDGVVRAPGPVEFSRNKMSGTGLGMTYEKARDVLTILDQAVVRIAPDRPRGLGSEATAGVVTFARRDRNIRFERDVRVVRAGEVFQADTANAFLTEDEKQIDSLELRGNSRVGAGKSSAGGMRGMSGRDMNLKYAADGTRLQHVLIVGNAMIQLAGEPGKAGRQLAAEAIDCYMGADGTTPVALAGRDAVSLTFPAEAGTGLRTIRAKTIDAIGKEGPGLTDASFGGDAEYREVNGTTERTAKSATLAVTLKPGMSSIGDAKFTGGVRFSEGTMVAVAPEARYAIELGVLDLSGGESAAAVPHVVNDRISIDAKTISITLDGPKMKAAGSVKSILLAAKTAEHQPADAKTSADATAAATGANPATKMPSMLKQDQPTNITADTLDYDGKASTSTYVGTAQLWQADTTVRAGGLALDANGNLGAWGSVATAVAFEQTKAGQPKGSKDKERVRSVGTSTQFAYEEKTRRATYTGLAHLTGPLGDIVADKVELYMKPNGDELERAEAYDDVTLRETARKTTGKRVTYLADEERYIVSGTPVRVVDQCNYETAGRTLTFLKSTDTILVDGKKQFRTYTRGSGTCPTP